MSTGRTRGLPARLEGLRRRFEVWRRTRKVGSRASEALLHRKNALFYKTENGAHVGDVFMSLIHTCELCGANPFDYLTAFERHAGELRSNPQDWLPWNYRQTLAELPAPR